MLDTPENYGPCVEPMLFTVRIAVTRAGIFHAWCYHTLEAATRALEVWRDAGLCDEPKGWHRRIAPDGVTYSPEHLREREEFKRMMA